MQLAPLPFKSQWTPQAKQHHFAASTSKPSVNTPNLLSSLCPAVNPCWTSLSWSSWCIKHLCIPLNFLWWGCVDLHLTSLISVSHCSCLTLLHLCPVHCSFQNVDKIHSCKPLPPGQFGWGSPTWIALESIVLQSLQPVGIWDRITHNSTEWISVCPVMQHWLADSLGSRYD